MERVPKLGSKVHQICILDQNILATFMRRAPNVQGAVRATVVALSTSSHGLTAETAQSDSMTPNSVQAGDSYIIYIPRAVVSGLRMKFPKDRTFTFDIISRSSSEDTQVKVDYIIALKVRLAFLPSMPGRLLFSAKG